MINVLRVKSRVEAGGHDVPEEKIIKRYDRALALVKELIRFVTFVIYDNSEMEPFRIFKKREAQLYYDECEDWYRDNIVKLTGVESIEKKNLN